MAKFPNGFGEHHIRLMADDAFDQVSNEALLQLEEAGFEPWAGIMREDMPAITAIAGQESVREFCPRDITERWGSEAMAEEQLAKNGGRAVFILRQTVTGNIAVYGWTRLEKKPPKKLPDCPTTFAVRLISEFGGRGLAAPFSRAIIAGSVALYGAKGIGLETWDSNVRAVKAYKRSEDIHVPSKPSQRTTLQPMPAEAKGMIADTRLFMKWPHTL